MTAQIEKAHMLLRIATDKFRLKDPEYTGFLYEQAGNIFFANNYYREAGIAYENASYYYSQLPDNNYYIYDTLLKSINAWKYIDINHANDLLTRSLKYSYT